MEKQTPQWVLNKYQRDKEYQKTTIKSLSFKLNRNTDAELIEIYERIPDKAQWIKQKLREYAAEHPISKGE